MTTPINDFQDILDAMERNPALRDALRRLILDDELRQMPVRLERVEEDIAELKAGQARLEEGQTRLESRVTRLEEGQTRLEEGQARLEGQFARLEGEVRSLKHTVDDIDQRVTRIGGDVSNLKGSDYESFVTEFARRNIWREMKTLATVFSTQKQRANLTNLATEAEVHGQILEHEADSVTEADLVLTTDGAQDYILAEISVTVQQRDIDHAQERADILSKATGENVTAIAIGATEEPNLERGKVQILLIQQYQET